MSLGTLLKEADRVRNGTRRGRLPRSYFGLLLGENLMRRASPDQLASYVRSDFSLGRISARVPAADADRLVAQAPDIENMIVNDVNGPGLKVEPTGFVILMDAMRSYLIRSQITSVLLAFATITFILLVLFRSWKLALFSMIPNVGPVILGLAFMAVVGIGLDPGTVMIATIALGLVVDDTCHFLVRLQTQMRLRGDLRDAIAETLLQTGRPIILTSIILAAGFLAATLGSFAPTVSFGLVAAFVLLTALVADLVLLPAALMVVRPKLQSKQANRAEVQAQPDFDGDSCPPRDTE
jgi:predicted RND superfamily exporter protein